MKEFTTPDELRAWRRAERVAGRRIGFVPTMGFLHEGHLRLVDAARAAAGAAVVSIFVNPLQFGPGEDLARYPRDLPRDRALAAGRGVAALFVPEVGTMYPAGAATAVTPGPAGDRWEGEARPGHFRGMLTVVAKLFNLVEPEVAVFGQKDIQQAVLVRRMVRDLDWPIEIVVVPTVREPDGLALSSRNSYLDDAGRRDARALSSALRRAHDAWRGGLRRAAELTEIMEREFRVYPRVAVDYIAVVDPWSFEPVDPAGADTVLAVAARVGPIRLIDNITLGTGLG